MTTKAFVVDLHGFKQQVRSPDWYEGVRTCRPIQRVHIVDILVGLKAYAELVRAVEINVSRSMSFVLQSLFCAKK